MSERPTLVALDSARAERERVRQTPPAQSAIVDLLQEALDAAKRGEVWAVGLATVRIPGQDGDFTSWRTTAGHVGAESAPLTFIGTAFRMVCRAERDLAGLPTDGNDVPGNPPPAG